jgi:hypothetical protein
MKSAKKDPIKRAHTRRMTGHGFSFFPVRPARHHVIITSPVRGPSPRLPPCEILHGDKVYDSNAIRQQVEAGGVLPNIPPRANRKWKNCFSPFLYRNRNAIER